MATEKRREEKRRDETRRGEARRGETRREEEERRGEARRGEARRDEPRRGEARRGEARGGEGRFLGWGGEDDAMGIKVRRAGAPSGVRDIADGFHLFHERANRTPDQMIHYQDNLALLRQLETLPDAALKRLSEVSWFLAGNQDMHRPLEPLA